MPNASAADAFASTATDCVRGITSGRWTSEQMVRASLERAIAREEDLHAWACLGVEEAMKEARQRDRQTRRGLLHGLPIGIKDLSDTQALPTAYGSPAYAGHRPFMDAACVALARAAGAVILGKTATVEFGATRPCATTNPHNKLHTPGGSSAGSAAAVADGQILLATGTQTGGSIIRPAAFCGAVGFKPTFGALSPAGTKGYSWSLDTVGAFATCVSDVALFFDVLRGRDESTPLSSAGPAPRIGFFPGPFADRADPAAMAVLDQVAARCSRAGAMVRSPGWPGGFELSLDWHRTVSRYEMGRSLLPEQCSAQGGELGPTLLSEIERGRHVDDESYVRAKAASLDLAVTIEALMADHDVLLTLATPGEAPAGLASTGDATFNLSWSLLGLPCLSLPVARGPLGLPLSVQLVGARHGDRQLLEAAHWIERIASLPQLKES
ncbi:amidase [Variovorax sp. LjRoot290]|uniref:amidase n=1 Tax=Variovorax sp. LjRoot290 TaxID=3342316 RepID=UPI003ECFADF2